MTFVDPYFDQENGVLRNLLGASSPEELTAIEPQIVFANELELSALTIPRTNDLDELRAIHRQLFRDVFDWAGKIRTVDIKKDEDSEFFLIVSKIPSGAAYVFGELAEESGLRGLSRDAFVERLSYFYDQLNYIHPFREGNGRTQRVFWSRVARDAGYQIAWDEVVGTENDDASRLAAEQDDRSQLVSMFQRIIKEQ